METIAGKRCIIRLWDLIEAQANTQKFKDDHMKMSRHWKSSRSASAEWGKLFVVKSGLSFMARNIIPVTAPCYHRRFPVGILNPHHRWQCRQLSNEPGASHPQIQIAFEA